MIHEVPKDRHSVVVHTTCDYHKEHSGPEHRNYAGCMCGSKYSLHSGKEEDCAICKNDRRS